MKTQLIETAEAKASLEEQTKELSAKETSAQAASDGLKEEKEKLEKEIAELKEKLRETELCVIMRSCRSFHRLHFPVVE